MKSRFWVYVFVLILAGLAVLLWHRYKQQAPLPEPIHETVQPVGDGPATANSADQNISQQSTPVLGQPMPSKSESDADKIKRIVREANEPYHQPIEFYGQIIDQYSNPVPNVKIRAFILHEQASMPTPSGDFPVTNSLVHLEKETGVDGRFEVTGEEGRNLTFEAIQKDGYEVSGGMPQTFGAINGTRDNPVVFKIWKLGEKAQLISGSKFWGIVPDGRTYTVDFLQQSKTEDANAPGDIKISITRPAQIKPREKFDWSFSIEAVQGGLIATDDAFMYLAPESGYQPTYTITMSATNADWRRELDGLQFYFKTRSGQVYGNFRCDIIPDYNAVSIFNVSWSANPSDSRNLQP